MAALETRAQAEFVAVLYHERGPSAVYGDDCVADLLPQAAALIGTTATALQAAERAARKATRGRPRLFVLTPTGGNTRWHRR